MKVHNHDLDPTCPERIVGACMNAERWAEVKSLAEQVAETRRRAEKAEQECRDRECTERDVRARLADAENTLAKVGALAEKWQADYDNNWNEYGDGYAEDLRAALDGTS